MKSIALIEPAMHHEVLDAYLFYLKSFVGKIFVFTNERVKNLLLNPATSENLELFIQPVDSDFNSWLSHHKEILAGVEFCIVTTHQIKLGEYVDPSFLKNPLLVVHNSFSTFYPYSHLYLSRNRDQLLLNLLRFARTFIMGYERTKRKSLSNYHGYLTTSDRQHDYILSNYPQLKDKIIPGPISYFLELSAPGNSNVTKIVIPGTVDIEVRDYEMVYQAFSKIEGLQNIELIFLGKVKNEKSSEIVKRFSKLSASKKFTFTTFAQTIPTQIYNEILFHADFLIIPGRRIIREGISYIVVGESGISGALADAILYAQPCLVPDYLIIPEILSSICNRYENAVDLATYIIEWKEKPKLQQLKSSRDASSWSNYQPHNIGFALIKNIQQYLSK